MKDKQARTAVVAIGWANSTAYIQRLTFDF